ncbi:Interferon-induced protein with tetratricopeptide repeats 3, partial [Lemmus lemmus]
KCLESRLQQLKCHFTWNLIERDESLDDFEDRVINKVELQNSVCKATMCNILAYVKHLRGQNEAALKCLEDAEHFIQQQHPDQVEIRSLVTWGNYAWIYYHMGQLSKAEAYLDKVRGVCEKFSSPYRIESPEPDCEEGWARLKCTQHQNERVKVYFEKALEKDPKNPEFTSGWAMAIYRLDYWPLEDTPEKQFSADALKQALELNSNNQYVKALLALKLQVMGKKDEGEQLIEDALGKAPDQADVLQKAAQFFRRKGNLDRAIEVLVRALRSTEHNSPLYCSVMCHYREKLRQLQNRGDAETHESKEVMEKLRGVTIEYMHQALQRRPSPLNSYSDLIDFLEVDRCYQLVFSKESPPAEEQQLYQRYCDLQEAHRKSEDLAALKEFLQSHRHEKSIEKEEVKEQA